MSWNKNTIRITEIDATLKVLKATNTPYTLETLGSVSGNGINDDDTPYECRKLVYGDVVLMERMEQTEDCDTNDYFTSFEFVKGEEPEDWELTYEICCDEEDCDCDKEDLYDCDCDEEDCNDNCCGEDYDDCDCGCGNDELEDDEDEDD